MSYNILFLFLFTASHKYTKYMYECVNISNVKIKGVKPMGLMLRLDLSIRDFMIVIDKYKVTFRIRSIPY